ncbi:MAG: CDP-alcohol phosphatidyltransferase family protein [Alphaproteobacteria bacterium]
MYDEIKSTTNNFVNKLKEIRFFKSFSRFKKILKKFFEKTISQIAKRLHKLGITANHITIFGFIIGMFSINFLSYKKYGYALICILINRFFDILDGAIARISKVTKFGIFLDTLFDYIFYSGVIFGFAFAQNGFNVLAASFLLFSLLCVSCSMLSYALIDNKNFEKGNSKAEKEMPFYLKGVIQGYEVFAAIVISCLFPSFFSFIAVMVGILCLIKSLSVIIKAYYNFVVLQKNEE